ncbi:MAG: MFS transporter [Synergistaceae bacterium]|jgi:acyl-[acyl-carrier-protein]-phospholipid O-acyltransferase/long-chain-fatty-acid--[acyl-carrier-protein] ligase|nr:MFS transporter [Synergistaceae bacterium]
MTHDANSGGRASTSQFALFKSVNFAPLFFTMFLGAFNDNFFKSAMVILITYRLAGTSSVDARILVTFAAGVFILPFVAFSVLAGQLADKYERSRLVRKVKIAEIFVMALAVVGFSLGSVAILMTALFAMGTQSAFFGPLKYSILPQHLGEGELIAANALIETGTFLSILFGTIAGGIFVMREGGVAVVSFLVVGIAVAGWAASLYIPPTRAVDPFMEFRFNLIKETVALVNNVRPRRDIFLSVIGISWFYFVGGTFLSQFPAYAKTVIGADEQVATLFLAAFSVGIAAGSLACNGLLKGEVSGRYVPRAALGMALLSVFLYAASLRAPIPGDAPLIGALEFVRAPANVAVLLSLLGISFFGGLYIVPLYAIIQSRSSEADLAGVTACTNIMDSLFMVVSSLLATGMLAIGMSIPQIFLSTAVLTVIAAFMIRGAVREQMRRGEKEPG